MDYCLKIAEKALDESEEECKGPVMKPLEYYSPSYLAFALLAKGGKLPSSLCKRNDSMMAGAPKMLPANQCRFGDRLSNNPISHMSGLSALIQLCEAKAANRSGSQKSSSSEMQEFKSQNKESKDQSKDSLSEN
jgi:hypothetical protein